MCIYYCMCCMYAVLQSPDGIPLPVKIIKNETSTSSEASINYHTHNILEISWDFGAIHNIPNSAVDNSELLLQAIYTIVILESNTTNVPFEMISTCDVPDLMLARSYLNASTVHPFLIVEKTASVSQYVIVSHKHQ